MSSTDPNKAYSLGTDIRVLRKTRGLTLQDVADALGRSVGWVSQLERNISEPSVTDLRQLAEVLDVAVSTLFPHGATQSDDEGYVIRRNSHRPIGQNNDNPGLTRVLLSPDLTDSFEVVQSTFAPFSESIRTITRSTREVVTIVAGKLDMTIDTKLFMLQQGDSFRIRGEPFGWANPYPETCVAIWVIAPPVY